MNAARHDPDRLCRLLWAMRDGTLSSDDAEQLRSELLADPQAREAYVYYMFLSGSLEWDASAGGKNGVSDFGVSNLPLTTSLSPLSPLPFRLSPSFVGGPVFSYMVATVVLCLMLLGAWAYKINHDSNLTADNSRRSTTSGQPELVFVGRITGMKDCRWSNTDTQTVVGASVPLDREYALSSGLLEITYKSGATVILEGPCKYKVESTAGGSLARGKLTARIIHQGPAASAADAKPQAVFCVKTPTAVVTDLGTEFGVEVAENGDTTSHVFQGSVKVETVGGTGSASGIQTTLSAGDSVFVKKDETNTPRFTHPTTPPKFVRRMVELPKSLDLLDIVAGGDGTGRQRERGIDPATGKQDTWFVDGQRVDDHAYHRVAWHPFIDGVFMPYVPTILPPQPQDVQLDSAGNTFDQFLEARMVNGKKRYYTVQGYTTGSIWARAADANSTAVKNGDGWIYSLVGDEQYMPEGHGILGLHANVGITFDLTAMRKMHEGAWPARLRAKAGMGNGPRIYTDAIGVADLWIFLDGSLKWVRKDIRHQDGAIEVDVPIETRSRFLTIVSTRGRPGRAYDWIVLGDPVLQMSPTETKNK